MARAARPTEEGASTTVLATRDLAAYPPPGDGPGWTETSVAAILRNPKYTGHMVYGRTRKLPGTKKSRPVPPDQWIWSAETVHEPLTDRDTWDKAQTIGAERGNVRDAEKPTTQPGTRYALRSRIRHQACQRRMYGVRRPSSSKTSPGAVYTYYHCPYNPSNPRHVAAHPDHPATSVSIRHETIMAAIAGFLDQWVFGHDRAAMLAAQIPAASAEQAAARQRQEAHLTAELARIATAQAGLFTELERLGADTSPATQAYRQRIQARHAELHEEHARTQAQLVPWPSTFAPFSAGLGGLLGFPSLVDRVTLRGMAGRVRVREISDDEGNRLKRVVRRGAGSVVTWRRAQMVLWSAQGMSVAKIADLAFTSEDRVRDVLHNFNADGFESLYPRYAGGRPPVFTLAQRREIKKIAKSSPADHGLPFPRWSLAKLAEFLVAEGVVEDISHEGLRKLLRAENVSFQAVKTWKASADPDYAAKKARVDQLYAIADGKGAAGPGDPDVVYCVDEFGPLNLQPRPGRAWARRGGTAWDPGERPRRRLRATYHRTGGVRHLFAALELGTDKMYGHIKKRKRRGEFLQFCRYLRSLHPLQVRIAIVCDNFSPHLTTRKDKRVGRWAAASNAEIAYTPANSSWMNRIECQFTALREFTLNGTDHATHREQGSMIRRYIAWRNRNTGHPRLRRIVERANVA